MKNYTLKGIKISEFRMITCSVNLGDSIHSSGIARYLFSIEYMDLNESPVIFIYVYLWWILYPVPISFLWLTLVSALNQNLNHRYKILYGFSFLPTTTGRELTKTSWYTYVPSGRLLLLNSLTNIYGTGSWYGPGSHYYEWRKTLGVLPLFEKTGQPSKFVWSYHRPQHR